MSWHARSELIARAAEWERENARIRRAIQQRRNQHQRRRPARAESPELSRAIAAAILAALPEDPPAVIAERREQLGRWVS